MTRSRMLSSCRWMLPLVLLLMLSAILRLRPDLNQRPSKAPAERQAATAVLSLGGDSAALDDFDSWLADGRRPQSLARGVELAQARRVTLKELIRIDPQAALARAVPYSLRRQLPEPVVKLLETPVSTTADLVVEQACGGPGGSSFRQHWLSLGERRLQVFTYGERAEVMTKNKLSVHGIAIDEVMAMRDDPLRELSAEEAAERGFTGRVAQLGNRLFTVETEAALEAARQKLRQTEETLGPIALPAYRELALGQMEGMFPLAMLGGSGGAEEDLPPVAFSPWTEGAKTMLYIRARFADELPTYEPVTLANAQARQGEAEAFWQENSYGKSTLTTTYTSVVTLPKNGSAYVTDFNTLHTDARAAALAANPSWNHANFSFYTVVTNYATNAQGNGFPYTGIAQLSGKASHLLRNFISVRTASHEYGHNLGLNHSEYWLTDSPSPIGADSNPGGYAQDAPDSERIEYGHKFAIMSGQDAPGDFDSGRAHYAASDKNRLDWLATGNGDILSTTTSGTYRIYRHDVRSADFGTMTSGVARAIKINLPATDPTGFAQPYKYWLNYLQLPTNGIAGSWLPHGLQVDWRRDGNGFRAVQLDMTPYSRDSGPYGTDPGPYSDNNDKEDAVLLIGRTFSDTGADIHFTPIAKGGSNPNEWLDVAVNIGTQGTNTPPQIQSFTVSNAAPGTGQTVNFAVTATDSNGDALAYHWDMGDNTVQSGQLNNATRAKLWNSAGYYTVRVEVSDMKGGKATAYRVISVGSPVNNGTWTNASGGSWATNTNWVGNLIAGGAENTADFSTLNPTADTTVTLDATRAIGNLVFGDSSPGSPATWFLSNGTGTGTSLLLAGASPTITVNPLGSGKFANISALLSGFDGFTKSGSGNLILNNANNSISGPVVLSGGNIQLNSTSLSKATTVAINAGTLVVATSAANAIGGTISFGGGILQYNSNPGSDDSARFSTAANQQYQISLIAGREATFSSNLASVGGTLTKLNSGTLTLAAANTYTGGTTLAGGTLNFGNATALGAGALSFTGNSTLQAGGAFTLANAVNIAAGTTGTVDTNGNSTTLAGTLTGDGNLAKIGTGTLNIGGGAAGNTLAGTINVNAGTLAVDNITPSPGIQSFANMNGAVTVASGASFNFSQSFTGENLDNNITLSGAGTGGLGALNLWRNATVTGAITLAADATISKSFNTATISGSITGANRNLELLTLNANQPGMTLSGPIQLGTGGITVAGVANSGGYSIRLSGSNSYSGETRVVTGTLMLSGNARLHDASSVRIDSGAILHLDFTGTDTVASLYLGGVAMPAGTYGSLTSTAANKSSNFLGSGILQVGVANDYTSWAATQLPPVTGGPNGDDDNDGVQNLVEYALTAGGERGVFIGNTLTFTKRGAPYGGDVTYIIETSETLQANSWSPAVTHGPAQLASPISHTFDPNSPTDRFARLKVVKTP